MNVSLSILFILFVLYAFLGWCMEVIVTKIDTKKFINRGFLIGPICPIYGVGATLMQILLYKYLDDPLVLFVMAVTVCSFLEYITSYLMEKLFKARWWDYSDKKFNINGRVCLENLVAFGVLALLVMYFLNPFFINVLNKINVKILNIIAIILALITIVDIFISFKIINGFKHITSSIKKDNTEEITKRVKELLINRGGLYKRLVSAFDFKTSELYIKELSKKLKNNINRVVVLLEEEKKNRIDKITQEYNKKIEKIKEKNKVKKDDENDVS